MKTLCPFVFFSIFWVFLFSQELFSEVSRIEISERVDLLNGKPFGKSGAFEKIKGKVFFNLDPENPQNQQIVDLKLAEKNENGMVEAWANFMVLRPKNLSSTVGFLEVSNRGGIASMSYFNQAESRSLDPTSETELGDGFLMREGFTVMWVGWQFDVPRQEGLLRIEVPVVQEGGKPVTGLVRCDWTLDEETPQLELGHRGHIAYPVSNPEDSVHRLTVRSGRLDKRTAIPRESWRFVGPDNEEIEIDGGFQAGKIYELVYLGKNPVVVGYGLAAVRDLISYAKYNPDCPFPIGQGVAFGVSQTGRFLRHFLYQGFNIDEKNRKAFDGMIIHTAGAGRGSFNHRFAQPSRDAHRYSAFFYPTDIFPFSSREQLDPETNRSDGLLKNVNDKRYLPNIFYTNTGYEYWGRAASLIHSSIDGSQDIEPLENERIYHLASAQHFVAAFPPRDQTGITGQKAYRSNPLDFKFALRALVEAMKLWITEDKDPPESRYPRIDEGTLVPVHKINFPKIPGVKTPGVVHEAYRVDYGGRWEKGIIDRQPPVLGKAFPTLVPQVNELGNEMAGIKMIESMVPLATFYPWSLRIGFPAAEEELVDFYGTFIPLPVNRSVKKRDLDPRPAISQLYSNKKVYLNKVRIEVVNLVKDRFLLQQDARKVILKAEQLWDWIHK